VAIDRLERLPDGRLLYHLRHRLRDGTTQIVFEPRQLLSLLVALIPAPGSHHVRKALLNTPRPGRTTCAQSQEVGATRGGGR
jgi:hypothetical protein